MCGVFGVYQVPRAGDVIAMGLHALQHRGGQASGIATYDKQGEIYSFRKKKRISESFLKVKGSPNLKGEIGVGHCRYATAVNSDGKENIQPISLHVNGVWISMAHNGNFPDFEKIKKTYLVGESFSSVADTEVFLKLIIKQGNNQFTVDSVIDSLKIMRGSCSAVVGMPDRLLAIRDPSGNRPLYWGKKGNGYVIASEPCALDAVDVYDYEEVKPGTIMSFSAEGIKSFKMPIGELNQCSFELVYFAFPASEVFGVDVYDFRVSLGRALARECKAETDMIIGVPSSAVEIAQGFALERNLNMPNQYAIYRRHDVRSFIKPTEQEILHAINMKFAIWSKKIKGKRILLIDDSIVRGNTSSYIVEALRGRGAKEVHFVSALPPITKPCEYGISMKNKPLIASDKSAEEISDFIGADSVTYLTMESFHKVFIEHGVKPDHFCFACMDGRFW